MDGISGGGGSGKDEKKVAAASACDVDALRKCLEENKGDRVKCQAHIDAFRSSCSINPNPTSTTSKPQPQPQPRS